MFTEHCSVCGAQVEEYCHEHPAARIESVWQAPCTFEMSLRQVKDLRAEAETAGDECQVELCDKAIQGWPTRYYDPSVYSAAEACYYAIRAAKQ